MQYLQLFWLFVLCLLLDWEPIGTPSNQWSLSPIWTCICRPAEISQGKAAAFPLGSFITMAHDGFATNHVTAFYEPFQSTFDEGTITDYLAFMRHRPNGHGLVIDIPERGDIRGEY